MWSPASKRLPAQPVRRLRFHITRVRIRSERLEPSEDAGILRPCRGRGRSGLPQGGAFRPEGDREVATSHGDTGVPAPSADRHPGDLGPQDVHGCGVPQHLRLQARPGEGRDCSAPRVFVALDSYRFPSCTTGRRNHSGTGRDLHRSCKCLRGRQRWAAGRNHADGFEPHQPQSNLRRFRSQLGRARAGCSACRGASAADPAHWGTAALCRLPNVLSRGTRLATPAPCRVVAGASAAGHPGRTAVPQTGPVSEPCAVRVAKCDPSVTASRSDST